MRRLIEVRGMKIKFLILSFFIFFVYTIPINAENECVFQYLKINGTAICEVNCFGPIIKIKENSNICIQPNPDVKVYYRPIGGQEQPQETKRKNLSDNLCIIQPTSNFGYNYWVAKGEPMVQNIRIQVLTYDEYEKICFKKQENETKPTSTSPKTPELPSNPPEKQYMSNNHLYINGNNAPIYIENINFNGNQTVQETSSSTNFFEDFAFPIITGLIVLLIWKVINDKYFSPKRKTKKIKK